MSLTLFPRSFFSLRSFLLLLYLFLFLSPLFHDPARSVYVSAGGKKKSPPPPPCCFPPPPPPPCNSGPSNCVYGTLIQNVYWVETGYNMGYIQNDCSCSCQPGYQGTHCESAIDPCTGITCSGHGRCSSGSCTCDGGYFGGNCENYDSCYGITCSGQGRCSGGSCSCNAGYYGNNCESYDYCYGVDCNGGRCSGGSCSNCPADRSGSRCEIVDLCFGNSCTYGCNPSNGACIDPCAGVDCNNGYCSGGSCICNGGWSGTYCTSYNPCWNVNCNNGYCSRGSCVCDSCWLGSSCNSPNLCCSADCNAPSGGYCADSSTGRCQCNLGYSGSNCRTYDACLATGETCSGHGSCSTQGTSAVCSCNANYRGANCEIFDPCMTWPCYNGGTCSVSGSSAVCTCRPGYIGSQCATIRDNCSPNPCSNGGGCTNIIGDGTFSCNCAPGWTGSTCATAINYCQVTPCSSPGTASCASNTPTQTSRTCYCNPGYRGSDCSQVLNNCAVNPCQNGGTCNNVIGEGTYTCSCRDGYIGTNCQTIKDNCSPNQCLNGATCNNIIGDGTFSCNCAGPWIGSVCGTKCPQGSFCVGGTQNSCPSGSYCPDEQMTAPLPCPAGNRCPSTGMTTPTPCSTGSSQSQTGMTTCTSCAIRTYQDRTGQAGCIPCPIGSFCGSTGMSNPSPCVAGTYCPVTSMDSPLPCPAGSFCAGGSQISTCLASTYCPLGSGSPRDCDAGAFCDEDRMSTTKPCQIKYFCPVRSVAQQACPPGSICPSSSMPAATLCPAGQYCPNSLMTAGIQCPAGKYCPLGSVNPLDCPVGSYCPAGSSSPIACVGSQWCPLNSPTPNDCQAGYYCPAGTGSQLLCPATNYCPPKVSSPIPCGPGKFCPAGSATETSCDAGFYCPDPNTKTICPIANYCPANSINPTQCSAGGFCPTTGLSTPVPCDPGTYCPAGSSGTTPCPAQYYCPAGSASPLPCRGGFYCPVGSSGEISCPPSYFCPPLSSGTTLCTIRNFCPGQTDAPITCPTNSFCPTTGLADPTPCPPTAVCPVPGMLSFFLPPVVYSVRPTPSPNAGGSTLTVNGTNFLDSVNSLSSGFQTSLNFQFSSSSVPVALTCSSRYHCTGTVPSGQGIPTVSLSVANGSLVSLPLPRWPSDVFFAGTLPGGLHSSWCTGFFNPELAASGWGANSASAQDFLCSVSSAAPVNFTFLFKQSPASVAFAQPSTCIPITVSKAASNWVGSHLCYPSDSPFQFEWLSNSDATIGQTPSSDHNCLWLIKANDPAWSKRYQAICTRFSRSASVGVDPLVALPADVRSALSPHSYQYLVPSISSVTPAFNGPTLGGLSLTVTGTNLGSNPVGQVTIGGRTCETTSSIANTRIVCSLPPGEGVSNAIRVSVSGQTSAESLNFRYDPPVLTGHSVISGIPQSAGGAVLRLNGINFGLTPGSLTLTHSLGVSSCTIIQGSFTQSSLNFLLPAGLGFGNLTYTTFDGVSSNPLAFNYQFPNITAVSPANSPTGGGVLITVSGTSFGPSATYGRLFIVARGTQPAFAMDKLDDSVCSPSSWTDNQIVCQVPAGISTNCTAMLVLTPMLSEPTRLQSSSPSAPAAAFTYDPPVISSTAVSGPVGSQVLTLFGSNFGSLGAPGSVTLGGLACPIIDGRFSPTGLVCRLPVCSGSNNLISITVGNQVSNLVRFGFPPAYVLPVGTNFATKGVAVFNFTNCQNFGPQAETTINIAFSNGRPATVATIVRYSPPSIVSFLLPSGYGGPHSVSVFVNGQTGSVWQFFYNRPIVTSVDLSNGVSQGGYPITIRGLNFFQEDLSVVRVRIGPFFATVSYVEDGSQWDSTTGRIIAVIPAGTGTVLPIVVEVGPLSSSESFTFSYLAPTLTTLSVSSRPLLGGPNITISGSGFTIPSGGSLTVFFDTIAVPLSPVNIVSPNQVWFPAPAYPAGTAPSPAAFTVSIRRGTQVSSSSLQYVFDPPVISSISVPGGASTSGGSIITLTGQNFGPSQFVQVMVGASPCPAAGGFTPSDSRYACVLPAGQGAVSIRLTAGTSESPFFAFEYNGAQISSLTPANGPTISSPFNPLLITVIGTSFGSSGVLTIDGRTCNQALAGFGTRWSDTMIVCSPAPGEGRNRNVTISQFGQQNALPSASVRFSFDPPQINSLSISSVPTAGGSTLTVRGRNFGLNPRVTIGGVQCPVTSPDHLTVECALPPGQGANLPVIVTVAGQSSNSMPLSYDLPVIQSISPASFGPASGGYNVTISGSNFGSAGSNAIKIGPFSVSPSSIVLRSGPSVGNNPTHTIVFTVPAGVGASLPIILTAGNQDNASPSDVTFSYASPSVVSVSGCSPQDSNGNAVDCPVGGGSTLTVIGSHFGSPALLTAIGSPIRIEIVNPDSGTRVTIPSLTLHTDSQMQFTLPANPVGGVNSPLIVTVAGQSSSAAAAKTVSFISPRIQTGSLTLGSTATVGSSPRNLLISDPSSPTRISFTGFWFGNSASAITVSYGYDRDFPSKSWNCTGVTVEAWVPATGASSVSCNVLGGLAVNLTLQIRVGVQISPNSVDLLSFPTPVFVGTSLRLSSRSNPGVAALSGQSSLGDVLFFTARFVGPANWQPSNANYQPVFDPLYRFLSVRLVPNGRPDLAQPCSNVLVVSTATPNEMTVGCFTGPGSDVNLQLQMLPFGDASLASALSSDRYSYAQPPAILSVSGCVDRPDNSTVDCPTVGGRSIRLRFAPFTQANITVRIGSQVCANPVADGALSQVTCTLPEGTGAPASVRLIVGELYSKPANLLSYAAPTVAQITSQACVNDGQNGIRDCPRLGGSLLTVTGSQFGPLNTPPVVLIGGGICSNVQPDPASPHARLTCIAPNGTELSQPVSVLQFNGLINSPSSVRVSFVPCPPGRFAPSGQLSCTPAPIGTFTDSPGLYTPKACPSGTYANVTGLSSCIPCGLGNFSVNSGSAIGPINCLQCNAGQFNDRTGVSSCVQCPAGQFASSVGASACSPCLVGTIAPTPGTQFCSACSSGTFAPQRGQIACTPCPTGYATANLSSSRCDICPAGFRSPIRSSACIPCDPGTFSPNEGQELCSSCPAGTFSSAGSSSCSSCAPGRFASASSAVCTECPVGREALSPGSANCTDCPQGFFTNTSGISRCFACSPGRFNSQIRQDSCAECAGGFFTSATGAAACIPCAPGSYSLPGSSSCSLCPVGKFQNSLGKSFCLDCPVGQANPLTGQLGCADCLPGFAANSSGLTQCSACPAGYFASQSAARVTVRTGTSSIAQDEEAQVDVIGAPSCVACKAGTFGQNQAQSFCVDCEYGKYSSSDASASCELCAPGTFQLFLRETTCFNCTNGDVSRYPGQTTCLRCDPGFVPDSQIGGSSCFACPAGKFQTGTFCTDCAKGEFSNAPGSDKCNKCAYGSIAPNSGATSCDPCQPGFYGGIEFNTGAAADLTRCFPAPPGFFVSGFFQTAPVPCDPGSYSSARNSSFCTLCGYGEYQDRSNQSSCIKCPPGNYTSTFGSLGCPSCQLGRYSSVAGLAVCEPCEAGKSQSQIGQSTCVQCLKGYAQPADGQAFCDPCISGKYADRPGMKLCEDCLVGTNSTFDPLRSSAGPESCSPCPARQYQDSQGQSECKDCQLGRYSNETGLAICNACKPGSFQNMTGADQCFLCPPGTFAQVDGTILCAACPAGTYSDRWNSSSCSACPLGRYQQIVGQTSCNLCALGKYAPTPQAKFCLDCDAGSVAPVNGSSVCTACSPGFEQPATGQAQCAPCSVGMQAPRNGSLRCDQCQPGSISSQPGTPLCSACPLGSAQSEPGRAVCDLCRPGRYSAVIGATECRSCAVFSNPSRHYQRGTGMSTCEQCDANSEPNPDYTQCLCSKGFALKASGNPSIKDRCEACPDGAVCDKKGTLWNQMATKPGWWEAGNKRFYPCIIVQSCPGGEAVSKPLSTLFPNINEAQVSDALGVGYNTSSMMASPCGPHLQGPLCSMCEPGYTEGLGGVCFPCSTTGGSWILLVLISFIIFSILVFLYWLLLRADREILRLTVHEERLKNRENAGFVEDFDGDFELMKNRYQPFLTVDGPPSPKPNYTFKAKIVIGFAQIVTNLAISLQISWPSGFKAMLAYLSPLNFDFIQVSSVGCVVDSGYYRKLMMVIIVPICLCIGVTLVYLLPQLSRLPRTKTRALRVERDIKAKVLRKNTWKLILFTMFLVYPNVSSTIIRVYVCQNIVGFDYLRADFRILCYDDEWRLWATIAGVFVVVYPIGIPVFFFYCLWSYRDRLHDIGVRAQIGFLYDAFERPQYWFEMADMAHKIILTSLLALMPVEAQMPVAMATIMLYTSAILILKPYMRKSDDRLHLYAQAEILVLCMAAYVFQMEKYTDPLMDTVLTVVLIGLIILFTIFFLLQTIQAAIKKIRVFFSLRKLQRRKLEGIGAKGEMENHLQKLKEIDEEKARRKLIDSYADVLPVVNRADLRPLAREFFEDKKKVNLQSGVNDLLQKAGEGRVEVKRNPLWGLEGQGALYDPTVDDLIDDAVANPLNEAAAPVIQQQMEAEQMEVNLKKAARKVSLIEREYDQMRPALVDMDMDEPIGQMVELQAVRGSTTQFGRSASDSVSSQSSVPRSLPKARFIDLDGGAKEENKNRASYFETAGTIRGQKKKDKFDEEE